MRIGLPLLTQRFMNSALSGRAPQRARAVFFQVEGDPARGLFAHRRPGDPGPGRGSGCRRRPWAPRFVIRHRLRSP